MAANRNKTRTQNGLNEPFGDDVDQKQASMIRARVLKAPAQREYDINDRFIPWDGQDLAGIHTTAELIEALKKNTANLEVEARVLQFDPKEKKYSYAKLDKKGFLEAVKKNEKRTSFKEATDLFAYDMETYGSGLLGGPDPIQFLGGPFSKQLYYYDYLRMHALSFYAYHHDPIARAIVHIIRDFTLGRGFRVDCDNPAALALWRAFEKVNDLPALMDYMGLESSIYGETMVRWLPNNETAYAYRVAPGQEPPKGVIPRIRVQDPSSCWEIVTFPEDISRILYYQFMYPTQYQIFSGREGGHSVPTTKYVVEQVPPSEMQHWKLNSVSNEKRGRSDLFPALSYLKRLRDSVDYQLVFLQKQSSWAIDTTIDGNQADVDRYVSSMEGLGTIPTAGSEFAHTKKITRQYLNNSGGGGKGGGSEAFHWAMNMICAAVGIPYSYFGFQDASGQTRASALVATEPVAKKFQKRQQFFERIILDMTEELMRRFNIKGAKFEVTFPELITQDRSSKIKDLMAIEQAGYLSKERVAQIIAKEFGVTDFNFQKEQEEITKQIDTTPVEPLTSLPRQPLDSSSALTSDERKDIASNGSTL
jgi:hypothetical protein